MHKKRILFYKLGTLLLFILFILSACNSVKTNKVNNPAIKGVADLTSWDFHKEGNVKLNGEWEFYWNKLISPDEFKSGDFSEQVEYVKIPRYWNKDSAKNYPNTGYATYRLKLLVSKSKGTFALNIPVIESAYKLWINDRLISEAGKVGTNKESSKSNVSNSLEIFPIDSDVIYITIQVSNFNDIYGGIGQSLIFGDPVKVSQYRETDIIVNMFILGFITVLAFYHIVVFFLRKKLITDLMLSLTCFFIGVINLFSHNYGYILFSKDISSGPGSRLILVTLPLILIPGTIFIYNLYSDIVKVSLVKFINICCVVYLFIALLAPVNSLIYVLYIGFAMAIYVIIHILYVNTIAVINKKEGSIVISAGLLVIAVTAINDILYSQNYINTGFLSSWGCVAYLFSNTFVLTHRFVNSYFSVEEMSQKLLTLDKLKDEFLANTSHELRTPLNGIIGLTESLLDGVCGNLPEDAVKNLEMIVASGKRLSNLINDILDFSKLKNNDINISQKDVDLRQVTEVVLTVSKTLASSKDVVLENCIPIDFPNLYGDENRIQQILYNLVGNAVKFTEVGKVTVSAVVKENFAQITVKDTGIGIPKEKIDDIFKSFEQIDSSIEREYGGTGLGLSITKQLVELHGGSIWVISDVGVGSEFIFTIPLSKNKGKSEQNNHIESIYEEHNKVSEISINSDANPQEVKEISSDESIASEINKFVDNISLNIKENVNGNELDEVKILVVDDEKINIQVLVNQLLLQNYKVYTASNGMEAINMISKGEEFDLVLLDVMMPKMSGYEVCKVLREKFSIFELPVIMLTAKNQPQDIIAGFEAGANDYLAKPFDKNELLARAKTLIALKSAVRHAIVVGKKFESEKKQRILAEKIAEVSSKFATYEGLSQAMDKLLESLKEIVSFTTALVLSKESDNKYNIVSYKADEQYINNIDMETYSICLDKIFSKNKIFMFNPIEEEMYRDVVISPDIHSWLGIALVYQESITGCIILEHKEECKYSEHEFSIMSAFSAQAAISIENIKLFSKLKDMAIKDSLTRIYNRAYIFDYAKKEFNEAKNYNKSFCVVMADIDDFKKINDTYGHDIGDEVLKFVAKTIRESIRECDVLGRYGGEEFAIIMPDIFIEEAFNLIESIRLKICESPIKTSENGEIICSVSFGISSNNNFQSLSEMFKHADNMLYESKREGKNKVKCG